MTIVPFPKGAWRVPVFLLLTAALSSVSNPVAARETTPPTAGEPRLAALELAGTVLRSGREGRVRLLLRADGAFRLEMGPEPVEVSGFDGADTWRVDWSGTTHPLHFGDAEELRLLVGASVGDGREIGWSTAFGRESWTFEDPTPVEGNTVYRRWNRAVAGEARDQVTIATVTPVDAPDPTEFRRPESLRDSRIHPDRPAAVAVRRAPTGHLLVQAVVDGAPPAWFLFDSGAEQSLLFPAMADSLGLPEITRVPGWSMIAQGEIGIRRGRRLLVGPLEIENPVFAALDLSSISQVMGVPLVGVLGSDILARSILVVETAGDSLWLYDGATFDDAGLAWQRLRFRHRHPVIDVDWAGQGELPFRIDIGAGGPFRNVAFNVDTVSRLGLGADATPFGHGVAGSRVALGRVPSFTLAGHVFESPEVVFAMEGIGPFADPSLAGNIGVGFLEPFRVVFDYANERMAFMPRGSR